MCPEMYINNNYCAICLQDWINEKLQNSNFEQLYVMEIELQIMKLSFLNGQTC